MNICSKILSLIEELEDKKLYKYADTLTDMACRIVTAQYAGPQNLNLPIDTRVIPFSEMEGEFEDAAQKRKQYHPRLVPKEHEEQSFDDLKDIFGPQGWKEGDRNKEEDEGIFDINQDEQHEGASIFSLNGEALSGITQRTYDPKSAGYMGLEQFEWDHRDDQKKHYPTYSPN